MNFVSILLCLILASVALSARMTKPKLNLNNLQNKTTSLSVQKRPEERRQLSIFPRSSWKFIVTPLVYRKYVTQSPIIVTKKPLMKKIVLRDIKPNLMKVERTSKRPVMNTKFLSEKPMDLFKKPVHKVDTKVNLDFIDEPTEVSYETRNKNFYDGDFSVHGDYSEDIAAIVYQSKVHNKDVTPAKVNENRALKIEDFIFTPKVKPTEALNHGSALKIEDFIFTSKVKPVEVNTESAPGFENIKNWSENHDNVSPEEVADRNEFIFLNEKNKDNVIPALPEELIPITEVILATKPRVKRSVNVIEEENLGSTVSGFKFTVRDTQLTNNLMFKNINS